MIREYGVLLFVLFADFVLSQKYVKQIAPSIDEQDLKASSVNILLSGHNPVTSANYVPVDTMLNSFDPASNSLNPLAFDPISNVLAVVHRGKTPYAVSSGELWWNYSTDLGTSWHRSNTSVQNGQTATILARYPNMTIFNPSASTNMADILGVFSWPELSQTGFGWIGYGVSEGLQQSSYANIEQGPPAYGTNVPIFSDDSWIYWYADNLSDNSIRLWRTQDYNTVEIIDPPTWGTTRWINGNILIGGVAHNGVVYVGAIGSYTEEIGAGGWEIGYSKSTDHGETWSDWFVPDWRTIPGLTNFTELWDWKLGDTYVSYSGDIQVDADGNVHLVTGLTDSLTLQNAIVEIYETAPNVWAGKVITAAHNMSDYGYNSNDPGLGQTGPSIMMAVNKQRNFFAVQYTIGSPETNNVLCDLYYHTRALSDENWSGATNLTETNNMNEDGCHLAPYMATSGGIDNIFSLFWYERGNTSPTINQTNPAVIFVAAAPVSTSGNTVDITFNVDMGVQTFNGQFAIGEPVKIAGNFNGWNNGADYLTDVDGDTIYSITKTFDIGDTLIYKFIKRNNDWENDPNRQYIVPYSNSSINVYFNDGSEYHLPDSIDITFACNMEFYISIGSFNPATDTLSVRGNFNGWSFGNNLMFPGTENPNIYENTTKIFTSEGQDIIHKFAYFGPNGTTWENDPNKIYTITSEDMDSGYVYILRYFNDCYCEPITDTTVTIKFTVNMADAISAINSQPFKSIDDVRLCGANWPLRWPNEGWPNADSTKTIKLYDNGTNGDVTAGDNIWSRDVTFPQYSPLPIQYRYGANWGLPSNEGGNDNENILGADHFINLTTTMLSATVENVFGTMGTHTLINVVTDVEKLNTEIPSDYILEQNYPNPFNPSTSIRFSIPEAGIVSLKVFNLLGEEVASLLNEEKLAGNYEVSFKASDLSSGIYFYSISSNNFTQTKKMIYLK